MSDKVTGASVRAALVVLCCSTPMGLLAGLAKAAEPVAPAERRDSEERPLGGEFVSRYIAENGKGYVSRACGFDMNRDGLIGGPADRLIGDGKTTDQTLMDWGHIELL